MKNNDLFTCKNGDSRRSMLKKMQTKQSKLSFFIFAFSVITCIYLFVLLFIFAIDSSLA